MNHPMKKRDNTDPVFYLIIDKCWESKKVLNPWVYRGTWGEYSSKTPTDLSRAISTHYQDPIHCPLTAIPYRYSDSLLVKAMMKLSIFYSLVRNQIRTNRPVNINGRILVKIPVLLKNADEYKTI